MMSADATAQHTIWDYTDVNTRGELRFDYLLKENVPTHRQKVPQNTNLSEFAVG